MGKTRDDVTEKLELINRVKYYARQVGFASLGAVAKAMKNGTDLFETLTKEGEKLEARRRALIAKQKKALEKRADGLNQAFQERSADVMRRLRIPTRQDIQSLSKQVNVLNNHIRELAG